MTEKPEFAGLARIATMPTLDEDKESHQAEISVKDLGVNGLDDDMKNVQI
jgi:hypothetical protein